MTTYELLVIHSPLLTDQQHLDQVGRIKDVITRNDGTVGKEDVWGKRRLAYSIRGQREGFYTLLHFDTSSTGHCLAEVERFCKIEETVLRHLVTRAVLNKSLGTPPPPRPEIVVGALQTAEGVVAPSEPTADVTAPPDSEGAADIQGDDETRVGR